MTVLTTKRNPAPYLDEFPALRGFEEMMARLFNEPAGARPWTPAVDIKETDDALILMADIPGVKMEDIAIELENGTLSVSGTRQFESSETKGGFHRLERNYGSFRRAFSLPESVDAERVSASYDNGVLRVTMPKKELAKPRSIKVSLAK